MITVINPKPDPSLAAYKEICATQNVESFPINPASWTTAKGACASTAGPTIICTTELAAINFLHRSLEEDRKCHIHLVRNALLKVEMDLMPGSSRDCGYSQATR